LVEPVVMSYFVPEEDGEHDYAELEAQERIMDTLKSMDHQDGQGALQKYSERFKHADSDCLSFNRQVFPWRAAEGGQQQPNLNEEVFREELEKDLGLKLGARKAGGSQNEAQSNDKMRYVNGRRVKGFRESVRPREVPLPVVPLTAPTSTQDSDGEEVTQCVQCGLPIGDKGYNSTYIRRDLRRRQVHGDCMANHMVADTRKQDEERLQKEATSKASRREVFNIGWKIASVPYNAGPAEKMGCQFVPQGMSCLVLEKGTHALSVVPTLEPAGAVNLAYLSIALKVRRIDGREPLFSLDPVNPSRDYSMQVKRFEPAWLVDTCVGDVLFQSDYFLKELSLGEYEQPVVGMKSCFDHSWDEGHDEEWRAREWFIVRKAEVHVSEDNVLIPFVRMGVEAWEQVVDSDGELKDAKVTRSNHPLLRYAQAFTHNFDLIAERKSVIFHLRELAKASVLAKYLFDSGVRVPEAWLAAAGAAAEIVSPLEIPQLWNERAYSKIRVEDGTIVEGGANFGARRGIYGGVQFGLDRFNIVAPRAPPNVSLSGVAPAMTARRRALGPPAPRGTAIGQTLTHELRGVDLNLDNFDLSKATQVASHVTALQVGQDACAALGPDFWLNVDNSNVSVFKDEDRLLLASLFNPAMSDRRDEGDKFVPPDTSDAYLERLRNLMEEEDGVRVLRKRHFCSKEFNASDPGFLFPSSWKNYIEVDRKLIGSAQEGILQERRDYKAEAQMFDHVLRSVVPVFDKSTEEGIRFRVYKIGSLEVRTTQEADGKESVGAVFSMQPSSQSPTQHRHAEKTELTEQIKKVAMYVEKVSSTSRHYYVVVETKAGNVMVTEMHPDGDVTWKENPVDLGLRNSLAKSFRSADCRDEGVTIRALRDYQSSQNAGLKPSTGKRYAQGIYDWTRGETQRAARFSTMG